MSTADRERISLFAAERQILMLDHCEAGGVVSDNWKLTGAIADTVRWHHDLEGYSGENADVLRTVAVADFFANREGIGFAGNRYPDKISPEVFSLLGIEKSMLEDLEGAGERGDREGQGLPEARRLGMFSATIWGDRGSMPTPGPDTALFGGNTSCLELRCGDRLIIIDAGSGIRPLGEKLLREDLKKGPISADLFITHTHWDHIMGFPMFNPIYVPGTKLYIRGPISYEDDSLEKVIGTQLSYRYWPVRQDELAAKITYEQIKETTIDLGDGIFVTTKYLNHPILCLGYRVEYMGQAPSSPSTTTSPSATYSRPIRRIRATTRTPPARERRRLRRRTRKCSASIGARTS
jgi:hypothetical protein